MPNVGDICHSRDLDLKGRDIYIWRLCNRCGQGGWTKRLHGEPVTRTCKPCYKIVLGEQRKGRYGILSFSWKGGRSVDGNGYITINLPREDFFRPMATQNGKILEHRLVMAKHLGRCLQRWEIVHHKNHIKDDNRIENLQLVTDDRHKQITILENKIGQLEKRVTLLEAENELLKIQLQPAR